MVTHKRDLEGLKVWVAQLEFGLPGKLDNDITSISVNWGNTASCATPSVRPPNRVGAETPGSILYACIVLHTNLSTARTVHVVQRELNLDFSISKRLIPFSLIFSEYNAQLNCTRNNWTKLSKSLNSQIKILSLFLLRSIVKTTNLRRSVRYCFKSVILSNPRCFYLLISSRIFNSYLTSGVIS